MLSFCKGSGSSSHRTGKGRATKSVALTLAAAATSLAIAHPASATDLTHSATFANTDYVSAGLDGIRNIGHDSGTPITVAGVSGTVTRAFLYWHGVSNSAAVDPGTAYLDGNMVSGTNLGLSSDNCWGFSNSQAFRADVTAIVKAKGNGGYDFDVNTDPGTTTPINPNGASLLVFFDDGNPGNDRDYAIFDGNDSNIPNAFDADGWNFSLPLIGYTSGSAFIEMHVADGQTFTDDAVLANGLSLAATGAIFQGDSVPGPTNGPNDNGGLWDIKTFDIAPALGVDPNTLNVTSGVASDCLSGVVMVIDLPAGTAPPPNTEPFEKLLTSGPDADGDFAIDVAIEVGQLQTTQYDFTLVYNNPQGPEVLIVDTAPAEWIVTQVGGMPVGVACGESETVFNGFGTATVSRGGKAGKNCHSDTTIEWTPNPDGGFLNVVMETRQSPGKKNVKYAPTSCGALYLNAGTAKVYEIDLATGEPGPILFEADPLMLVAVEDVDGDGAIDPSGNGNEDGDALTDLEDVQLGFDPCSVGTGKLYAGTDEEDFDQEPVDRLAETPVVGGTPGLTTIYPIDTTLATGDYVNGLAPTGAGTLFAGDPLSSLHNEITTTGVTLSSVNGPLDSDCCNEDLAFDGTHVWRADYSEGPLFKYLPDGTVVATYAQTDIVGATFVKPSNTLWLTKWNGHQVGTFDPGTNTFTPVFSTTNRAGGLAYDIERGILWVGEQGGLVQAYDLTAGAALIAGSQHQPFGATGDTVDGLAFIPD